MTESHEAANQNVAISTSRLETFSDGVFAIAATLLILDVHAGVGSLGTSLLHIWPSYAAYGVSFVTIGIIWINHHPVFTQIGQVDRLFLLINVAFLMFVAFIPFPTSLIAAHLRRGDLGPAAITYGAVLTMTAVLFNALWFYASVGHRLLRADSDVHIVSGISRSYLPGPFIYLAATLIAFASADASVILFAAIAVFYVIESSLFSRKKDGASAEG
jgi:uncharacterized membrane protein